MRAVHILLLVAFFNTLTVTPAALPSSAKIDKIEIAGFVLEEYFQTVADSSIASTRHDDSLRPQIDADRVAIEMVNPINSLRSVNSEFLVQPFQGELPNADKQIAHFVSFTPSFSFRVPNGKNIIARATLPINLSQSTYIFNAEIKESGFEGYIDWRIRQEADVLGQDGEFYYVHDHMYDISFDVAYGGLNKNNLLFMFGVAAVLPTSEDISGARGQFLAGPEIAVGKLFKKSILGGWLTHLTNVANAFSNVDYNTNLTELKVFFAYGIGNGWQIVSNSKIVYDWEGADRNRLFLPLGGGISKTYAIRNTPLRFVFEGEKFLETPRAFGPDASLKFSVQVAF